MPPATALCLRFFFVTLFATIAGGCSDGIAQPEVHLLPQGYSGDVFILHDVADGEPLIREGWSRIYRIPPIGILRSSTDPNHGWGIARFYYLAADGSREKITGYWPVTIDDTPENRDDPEIGVFFRTLGSQFSSTDQCSVLFEHYFVGTKRQVLSRKDTGDGFLYRYLATHPLCLRGGADQEKHRRAGPGHYLAFHPQ